MLDTFKREISYLRISVTDRCNLSCTYCMPEGGVAMKGRPSILSYEQITAVAREAIGLGIQKIRLTGGEPLLRRDIARLVEQLSHLPGLRELTLTTNGVLLARRARALKAAGLHRLNISLDTLDPEKYKTLTRIGNIKDVLRGIDAAAAVGFRGTKVNMVLIPGFNDDEVERMQDFCHRKGMKLQRINHYSLENIDSINRDYLAERPLKCDRCNRIRLTADGKLKPCLFSDLEIPLDFDHLKECLMRAILSKPETGTCNTTGKNWRIGG